MLIRNIIFSGSYLQKIINYRILTKYMNTWTGTYQIIYNWYKNISISHEIDINYKLTLLIEERYVQMEHRLHTNNYEQIHRKYITFARLNITAYKIYISNIGR